MLAFFCFGARYRPWRYFAALHSRVFGDGAAPRRARSSRASTLSFVLLAGAFSKSCLRRRFFAGRAAVIWCGANPGVRPWQDLRECALGRLAVAIFSRDAFSGVLPMAKCSRNAFPSVRRRQDCALMRSWPDWQWQYSRAMRSRVSIRGNIPPRCVPGRPSVTIFSPHASQKRPRTGKSPVRGKIRAPCIRKRAPFGKICAPCIRKAPQTAFRERTARRSCQEGPLFAARTPRIMHGAQILPSAVAPNRPSARNPGAAEQREPPELDRPAQETQPGGSAPVASWAASIASSSLGTATALCQHQPVACRPANNSVIADSASCRDSIHAATAPPIRQAVLAQKGATFSTCGACLLCSWQMRSAYKRQAEPLLRDYFVMVA